MRLYEGAADSFVPKVPGDQLNTRCFRSERSDPPEITPNIAPFWRNDVLNPNLGALRKSGKALS